MQVKRFLSRKGIPTNHAVEKQELLDSIHYWALDLAAASDFVAGEDLEARMRIQDAECSTDRDTAPYRHHCHVDDGTLLHSLPIVELRRRLDALGVQHGGVGSFVAMHMGLQWEPALNYEVKLLRTV